MGSQCVLSFTGSALEFQDWNPITGIPGPPILSHSIDVGGMVMPLARMNQTSIMVMPMET